MCIRDSRQIGHVRNPQVAARWPISTPEFTRGADLVVESALAHEQTAKIRTDFSRLLASDLPALRQPLARHHGAVDEAALHDAFRATASGAASDLPANHLGALLATLVPLMNDEPAAKAQQWARHYLAPWAPAACEQLALRSATMFYQGVFALTHSLLGEILANDR